MADPSVPERDDDLLVPAEEHEGAPHPLRRRARRRILRSTAMLPSLVTLLNGLSGLGAIHFATKEALGSLNDTHVTNLRTAAWLIALAMVFDMLDGRLARMTRRTSDFGGQLDSLCDAISFGVAPAVLMVRVVAPTLRQVAQLGLDWHLERVVWSLGAVYVACAVLRLARFNVENEPGESAHMDFQGLPSPGAAAAIVALVLLFEWCTRVAPLLNEGKWLLKEQLWFLVAVSAVLPVATLCTALFMVSNFRYSHLVNQYVRGKRPFGYLVRFVVIGLAIWWQPFATIAVFACIYALSGPTAALFRWVARRRRAPVVAGAIAEGEPADADC